jgi:hypothetical protein
VRDSNWRHCDDSDNKSDDSWPKWRPLSHQNVVSYDHVTTMGVVIYDHVTTMGVISYDHVTTTRVVSYDHVTTTRVVSYDHVTTTRVVSYDLVPTLTDDSTSLSWIMTCYIWRPYKVYQFKLNYAALHPASLESVPMSTHLEEKNRDTILPHHENFRHPTRLGLSHQDGIT